MQEIMQGNKPRHVKMRSFYGIRDAHCLETLRAKAKCLRNGKTVLFAIETTFPSRCSDVSIDSYSYGS